jgi:hypothetical protein
MIKIDGALCLDADPELFPDILKIYKDGWLAHGDKINSCNELKDAALYLGLITNNFEELYYIHKSTWYDHYDKIKDNADLESEAKKLLGALNNILSNDDLNTKHLTWFSFDLL